MNREHQGLLDIMNKLFDASERGETGENVLQLLDELEQATVAHFANEEAYFDSISFPEADLHKAVHKRLLANFGESAAKIRESNGIVDEEFFQFLRYWLTAHIRGIDSKYGAFSSEQKAAS